MQQDRNNKRALSDDYFPEEMNDRLDDNDEDDDVKACGVEDNLMYLDQLGNSDALGYDD